MSPMFVTAGIAFFSSAVGAVVLLLPVTHLGRRVLAGSMGFCAGVMLGAAVFGLIVPSIKTLRGSSMLGIAIAIFLGAIFMELFHRLTPHEHFAKGHEGPVTKNARRVFLVVAAIALHNFPEGLSLGSGYMQTDSKAALSLLIGIGTQNIPEGLLVAIGLLAAGASRWHAFLGVIICACVEAFGAVLGSYFGVQFQSLLPWCLLASAGAMIYVVSQEMIPESHGHGFEGIATFSTLIGFVGMLTLSISA